MRAFLLAGAAFVTLGSSWVGAAAPKVVASAVASGQYSTGDVTRTGAALYSRLRGPEPRYAVHRYDLRVRTRDAQGRHTTVGAQVFVPQLGKAGRVPVYVLGPGTTGLADACSVFRERPAEQSWGWYQGHALSYASQGMIVTLVDYVYFDDPKRLQPYFVSKAEAPVLLDAARAALQFVPGLKSKAQPAPAVFFSGYSQGGHSSFAAADAAARYAPDVPVRGLVVFGATTNVQTLLLEHAAFAPYVLAAYEQQYGADAVPLRNVLLPGVYAGLDTNARRRCVGDLHRMYGRRPEQVFQKSFVDALRSGRVATAFPGLARVLRENNAGMVKEGAGIPAFVAQGTADDIVTAGAQQAFVREQCRLGRRVTYREYPGINHYQTRQAAVGEAIRWIFDVTAGKLPASACQ